MILCSVNNIHFQNLEWVILLFLYKICHINTKNLIFETRVLLYRLAFYKCSIMVQYNFIHIILETRSDKKDSHVHGVIG